MMEVIKLLLGGFLSATIRVVKGASGNVCLS